MKKLLFIFLLLLPYMTMSGERKKDINISFDKDDFTILVENDITHISTAKFLCSYENDIFGPGLPLVHINILVGPDEELIDYSSVNTEKKLLEEVLIAPRPRAIPTNTNIRQKKKERIIAYTHNTYPQDLVNYIGSYIFNGYKYLTFEVSPFKYDNINHTLYFEENYTFNLSLRTSTQRNDIKLRENDEAIISDLVINPEDLRLYNKVKMVNRQGQQTSSQYEYAIITNNNLKPVFQKLAEWKTLKGIRTKVLTVEEIYSNYPSNISRQMKIKRTLKELYETNTNFKYALLAGDVDIVPAQMCFIKHTFYHSNLGKYVTYADDCPTDLFYACFETMDWDTNKNGLIGEIEDNIDLSQNIAVSRASVSSSVDAEAFVNRVISYESAPNIQTWTNNLLMCGYKIDKIHNYSDLLKNDPYMNDMYVSGDTIISDSHYKGERLYRRFISSYLKTDSVSKVKFYDTGTDFPGGANYDFHAKNLQKELSKGYTFVNVDTHGNTYGWETESAGYTLLYADSLKNSNHTIIVTSACHTNAFDKSQNCLSEAFTRNPNSGVIAYFGCSRQGWEYADSVSIGPSAATNVFLYQTIFSEPNKNFGEMVRKAKETISSYCDTYYDPYRWLLFGTNPIGDPEMPIYTRRPKKFENVSISFSKGSLFINTREDDCKICVASMNDNGASFYDISTGSSASFSNLTDDYRICITKQGYVPYIARCGNNVYIQDESINTDYEVISNQTIAGSNVTTDKPNGPIEINKGKTIIKCTNGVTINDSFDVKKGASLEIRTN